MADIGQFCVVIVDDAGLPLAEVDRVTRSGRPNVGEEVEIDGEVYRVERVLHEEDQESGTRRRFTTPRLYVKKAKERDEHGGRRSAPVISLLGPPADNSSAAGSGGELCGLFPPSLVAVLVACGYRARAEALRRMLRTKSVQVPDTARMDVLLAEAETGYRAALERIQFLVECQLPTFILNRASSPPLAGSGGAAIRTHEARAGAPAE